MAITIGSKAPDVTFFRHTPEGVKAERIQDYEGKNVVMLFFPAAFTGVCTQEMCMMRDTMKDYEALNAVVVGISGDMPWSLTKFAQANDLTMPLLSDYNHVAAKSYDIEYPTFSAGLHGITKRSAFVVDKNGIIQYASVLDNANLLPNFEEIQAKLADLN